jgi:hypothetical protein
MQQATGLLDARQLEAIRRMHRAAAATLDRLDRTTVVTAASHDLLRAVRTDREMRGRQAAPGKVAGAPGFEPGTP